MSTKCVDSTPRPCWTVTMPPWTNALIMHITEKGQLSSTLDIHNHSSSILWIERWEVYWTLFLHATRPSWSSPKRKNTQSLRILIGSGWGWHICLSVCVIWYTACTFCHCGTFCHYVPKGPFTARFVTPSLAFPRWACVPARRCVPFHSRQRLNNMYLTCLFFVFLSLAIALPLSLALVLFLSLLLLYLVILCVSQRALRGLVAWKKQSVQSHSMLEEWLHHFIVTSTQTRCVDAFSWHLSLTSTEKTRGMFVW